MKIQVGVGNSISVAFNAAAKTLTFSGAQGFDIEPANLQVYNTTRSSQMIGGGSAVTASSTTAFTAGLPVQTVTLSAVPASSANGDNLITFIDVPDSVAIYNALLEIIP